MKTILIATLLSTILLTACSAAPVLEQQRNVINSLKPGMTQAQVRAHMGSGPYSVINTGSGFSQWVYNVWCNTGRDILQPNLYLYFKNDSLVDMSYHSCR